VLTPDYPIRTERLSLRPYEPADFEAGFRYWSREDVTRYLYLDAFTRENFGDRLAELMKRTALSAEGDVLTLAIVPDGVDHVVGDVTLFWRSAEHQSGEIGFILDPEHQRKGYAREAATALMKLGFEQMDLHRIVGRLDGRNVASAGVLRSLGLRQEAHLIENEWVKGEWTDEIVFAMLREEWLGRERSDPS
jgi:RimJ/RimL family protein N-acetyltransferase